jgi:hypothetical protein
MVAHRRAHCTQPHANDLAFPASGRTFNGLSAQHGRRDPAHDGLHIGQRRARIRRRRRLAPAGARRRRARAGAPVLGAPGQLGGCRGGGRRRVHAGQPVQQRPAPARLVEAAEARHVQPRIQQRRRGARGRRGLARLRARAARPRLCRASALRRRAACHACSCPAGGACEWRAACLGTTWRALSAYGEVPGASHASLHACRAAGRRMTPLGAQHSGHPRTYRVRVRRTSRGQRLPRPSAASAPACAAAMPTSRKGPSCSAVAGRPAAWRRAASASSAQLAAA